MAAGLVACAPQVEILNKPLLAGQQNPIAKPFAWDADRPFVMLAFSGGGSRASAMAYDTLLELDAIPDGTGRTLLDDVAVISSASGGSVTAAYFGLYGKAGLPDFYNKFLVPDNMWAIESQLLNPVVDAKLTLGAMGRVDAARALFDDELFDHRTYADLQERGLPIILLNATDMASGEVFAFGPSRFDDLCSNLSVLPISTAVAASSAFPILLSPITLRDFSGPSCPLQGRPSFAAFVQRDPDAQFINFDQYEEALYENDLQHGPDARTDIRYVHLLDGGLADNLGVTTLGRVITEPDKDARFLYLLNTAPPKKFVVISVRARSFVESPLYRQEAAPGEVSMIGAVTGIPLDANTGSLDDKFADLLGDLSQALQNVTPAGQTPPQVSYIDIDPDQLPAPQAALRNAVEAIPTGWTVTCEQRLTIQQTVHDLLVINPQYQALLAALKTQARPIKAITCPAS